MISFHEVRKMIFDEDVKAGRNVDRPKSYILQRWYEINGINPNKQEKDHVEFLSKVTKDKEVVRNEWKIKERKDKEALILGYLMGCSVEVPVAVIARALNIDRSTCGGILLAMYRSGSIARSKGGGLGCRAYYSKKIEQVAV